MKRIFITGCARSGTTLMNRLFYAFKDTTVIDHEIPIENFCHYECKTKILVGKRIPLTILSVPLGKKDTEKQLSIINKENILIVNVIRDGRDVVHQNSTGPRVNVNRWIGCMLQAQIYRKIIKRQVRYEELVNNPDSIQKQLAETLNIVPVSRFSEYPAFVPDLAFDEPEYRDFIYYSKRKINNLSVGHSAKEYINQCKNSEQRAFFERTLKRYGYLGEKEEEVWDTKTLRQEILNHKQDSISLGYIS